jgi:hypothetical protein
MTITVSIEELRDYESKCIDWTTKRGSAIQKILTLAPSHDDYLRREKTVNLTALKEWDAANPFPKLIPAL